MHVYHAVYFFLQQNAMLFCRDSEWTRVWFIFSVIIIILFYQYCAASIITMSLKKTFVWTICNILFHITICGFVDGLGLETEGLSLGLGLASAGVG